MTVRSDSAAKYNYREWAMIKKANAHGETPDSHDAYERACHEMKLIRRKTGKRHEELLT